MSRKQYGIIYLTSEDACKALVLDGHYEWHEILREAFFRGLLIDFLTWE